MHDERVKCAHLLFHIRGHPWILLWAARWGPRYKYDATNPTPIFFFNDGMAHPTSRLSSRLSHYHCRIFIQSREQTLAPRGAPEPERAQLRACTIVDNRANILQ